jgi:ATP-binding cassette subfamily C protein
LHSLQKFLQFLWQSARWQLITAIALSTLLSLTEGVSLAMVFPVISLLGEPGTSPHPPGPRTQFLFNLLTASHIPRSAWLASLLVVVMFSVGLLAQLNGMLATLTTGIILRLRTSLATRIFRSILHADWAFVTRGRSSDLTHVLTGQLPRVDNLSSSLIGLLSNGMVGVLMLCVALYLAPLLTLIVLVCFSLLIPWQRRVGRAIYTSGDEVSEKMGQVFDSSTERIGNLKVVKAYGAQDRELEVFIQRYGAVTAELMANQWRSIAASRWFQIFSMLALCAVILLGLGPLHLTAGTMLIFLFAFLRAAPRLSAVQSKTNELLAELPAFQQIETFLADCDRNSEQDELPSPAPTLHHELTLRGVTFAYKTGGKEVLSRIDLALAAGQITSIAGISGAGKSTVADIIMGLLVPQQGTVASDATPITRANARAWRAQVGYVSQDTLLFHDSIRANLLWAKPDATDADLTEALHAASAAFVHTLPHGIDTIVGDRGMMLSHGQRQRIALARAMLLKPALLILDEATNSLDLENEENILRSVQARGHAVTTLLISHRPSAVRFADRVFVLEAGKVTQQGSWEEVRNIVEAQAVGQALGAEPAL